MEAERLEKFTELWDKGLAEAVERAQKSPAKESGEVKYSEREEVLALEGVDWMGDFTSIKEQLEKHRGEIEKEFGKKPIVEIEYKGEKDADLDEMILRQALSVGTPNKEKNGAIFNRDGITFEFNKSGIRNMRSHASSNQALRAAAIIAPYISQKGLLIAGHRNHEGGGLTTLTYAAPALINNTPVNVGVVIQFDKNGKPRAVNVETIDGGKFAIKNEETAKRNRGRVDDSPGTTPPRKAISSIIIIPQYSENSNTKFQERDELPDDRELLMAAEAKGKNAEALTAYQKKVQALEALQRKLGRQREALTAAKDTSSVTADAATPSPQGEGRKALLEKIQKTEASILRAEKVLDDMERDPRLRQEAERALAEWREANPNEAARAGCKKAPPGKAGP